MYTRAQHIKKNWFLSANMSEAISHVGVERSSTHTSVKKSSAHRNIYCRVQSSSVHRHVKVKTERNSSNRVVKTVQLTDMSEIRTAQRPAQGRHVRAQTNEVRSKQENQLFKFKAAGLAVFNHHLINHITSFYRFLQL